MRRIYLHRYSAQVFDEKTGSTLTLIRAAESADAVRLWLRKAYDAVRFVVLSVERA